MNLRHIVIGVAAGTGAFVIGFEIGMSIYVLEPFVLFLPAEVFAGAFPGLRAWLRKLLPIFETV